MLPEEQKYLNAFSKELIAVGSRIGSFLHECIDLGVAIDSPKTRNSLSLTAYELGFVSEAIEQYLQEQRMNVLRAERAKLLKTLKPTKENPMKLEKLSTAELEAELARRKQSEEAKASVPSPLKLADFSKLQAQVIEAVQNVARDRYPSKNYEHYIYEAAMEAVYGKAIWDWWNKHADY